MRTTTPADSVTSRPLRVLHLIETLGLGGAEVMLADVLPRLAAVGIDVRVRALTGPDPLRQQLRDCGIDAEVLCPGPASGRRRLVQQALRLRRELIRTDVDVVHSHLFHATLVGRAAAFSLRRRPRLVTSLHSPKFRRFELEDIHPTHARLHRILDWATAMATGDRVVAVSEAVADDCRRHLGDSGPWRSVEVIHNAIDVEGLASTCGAVDRAAVRKRLGVEPEQLLVLSAGRLIAGKNYPMMIEAIRQLLAAGLNVRAIVIGDGPERARLADSGAGAVEFPGMVGREDVASALVASDVYVQTSTFEGFGLAILEAMAARRAVVATAVDGIPEVVEDGVTGHLVPTGDADALASRIAELARDASARRRMGDAGLERARSRFGLRVWVERTEELYRRICQGDA